MRRKSPADLLITVDAGNLHDAKLKNISQKIDSKLLNQLVPKNLRDSDGHWYGLSVRSRVIMYNPAAINPEEIMNYENLADDNLAGAYVSGHQVIFIISHACFPNIPQRR